MQLVFVRTLLHLHGKTRGVSQIPAVAFGDLQEAGIRFLNERS